MLTANFFYGQLSLNSLRFEKCESSEFGGGGQVYALDKYELHILFFGIPVTRVIQKKVMMCQ